MHAASRQRRILRTRGLPNVAVQLLFGWQHLRSLRPVLPDSVRTGGLLGRIADNGYLRERQLRTDDIVMQRVCVRLGDELV